MSENSGNKKEPLIGYMVLEDWAEDYSQWDGSIAFPDPEGANLHWVNTIPMIEKAAFDELKAENERLKQQSLGTQLVTAIAGIPYVPPNELEVAMLKAENERLQAIIKDVDEGIHRESVYADLAQDFHALKTHADQLAQGMKAKMDLLVCYRTGKSPSEALFKRLEKADEALAEYAKFREGK